jgi:hypothetical protein
MNLDLIVLERALLLVSSMTALYYAIKEKKKFPIVIATIFTLGFAITITNISYLILSVFILVTLCSLLVFLYAGIKNHLHPIEKITMSLTALVIFIGNLFALEHWSYWNQIRIISILPLIAFSLFLLYSRYRFKCELFITLTLVIVGIFRFITLWD